MTLEQPFLFEVPRSVDPLAPPSDDLDECYTPPHLFAQWHREFRFTVDAASAPIAAKLSRFWSREDNGLAQSWGRERVWCNPPYSNIPAWVEKAHHAMTAEGCELVAMLLPATRSEQPWWQEYVEPYRDRPALVGAAFRLSTRFLAKRIAFGRPDNPTAEGAKETGKFPSVLLVWSSRHPSTRSRRGGA